MTVFLATLGQRPEAITMALDTLLPRYHYSEVLILHTDPEFSGVARAYADLMPVLRSDYPNLKINSKVLCYADGKPIIDISNQYSAESYYHALLEVIREYRVQFIPIHLLVAGGRKAMSIYAALAAELLFGEYDCLWTVHTPYPFMQANLFHLPVGMQDQVHVIQLPVQPSRLLPGVVAGEDIHYVLERARTSPRQMFLQSLTEEENKITETLRQHPYASNEELGALLGKSSKTIENQLRMIYGKLFTYFDLSVEDKRKRQALLDVLAGRV